MALQGSLRVAVAIVSILVALAAAFHSLLPRLPVPEQVSKAATALSRFTSQNAISSTNVTMPFRPPVYFFSHGGVRTQILLSPLLNSSQRRNQPDVMYNKEHAVYPVLQDIGNEITQKVKPKAVVVFSAHWQAKSDLIQVNNVVENDLIYELFQPLTH